MNNSIIKYLVFGLILWSACTNKNSHQHTDHHDDHEDNNGSEVGLTIEQMKSIEVVFGKLEKKPLTSSLKANGYLKVPNNNRAIANSLSGGIIKSILVQVGSHVKKGQTLATVINQELIVLQENYLSTTAKYDFALLEYNRLKDLYGGNATALKNLQSAESQLKTLDAQKSSLQKQLALLGISTQGLTPNRIQSQISITSPINGAVSDIFVNIGSSVASTKPIAEIVDNSQLHVDLYVYEKDLSKLKIGQIMHFTLTNNPGKEYDADIHSISNTFEENTKAVAVHASVKGDKTGLIDGMGITGIIDFNNETVDALPSDAIVNFEGQDYIFIMKDALKDSTQGASHGHSRGDEILFERIPIRKGVSELGYSEVTMLKEIPRNSQIVVHGAFFILAKMNNKGQAHSH